MDSPATLFGDGERLTHWIDSRESIPTVRGPLSGEAWCAAEARRVGGRVETDPEKPHLVAVYRRRDHASS